jgi:ketosteroid isomerase-like protein
MVHDTAVAASLWRQRERLGDLEAYETPRKTDRAQWADDTSAAMIGTEALIDALGENNPILRDMLQTAKQEIYTAATENAVADPEAAAAYADATTGRRLMQRKEYNVRMTDALITAEIMEFYGKGGIPGVTQASVMIQKSNPKY